MRQFLSKCIIIVLVIELVFINNAQLITADNEEKLEVSVNIVNCYTGKEDSYQALIVKDEIYLSADDISEISGYDVSYENSLHFAKAEEDITFVDVDTTGKAYAMGKEYDISVVEGDIIYLPLEKMLYLLHAQWWLSEGKLYVNPAQVTIFDVLTDQFLEDIWSRKASVNSLLMNGEGKVTNAIRTSAAAILNDFDPKVFVIWFPGEGVSPSLNDIYEEAMLSINENDEDYLSDKSMDTIFQNMKPSFLEELSQDWQLTNNALSLPSSYDYYEKNGTKKIIMKVMQNESLDNYLLSLGVDVADINPEKLGEIADKMDYVSKGIDIFKLVCTSVKVCNRSKKWEKGFLDEIGILSKVNEEHYVGGNIDRIKKVAKNIITEKKNAVNAAAQEAAEESVGLLANYVFDLTPAGILFNVSNIGLAFLRIDKGIDTAIEAADYMYTASCLIQIEDLAIREYGDYYLEAKSINRSEESIQNLRNCAMLILKANLRNKANIYLLNRKLNNDSHWEETKEAKAIKNDIYADYASIVMLTESAMYDHTLILDSFSSIYDGNAIRCPIEYEKIKTSEDEITLETMKSYIGKPQSEISYDITSKVWHDETCYETVTNPKMYGYEGKVLFVVKDDVIINTFWASEAVQNSETDRIIQDLRETTAGLEEQQKYEDQIYWADTSDNIEYYINFHESPLIIGVKRQEENGQDATGGITYNEYGNPNWFETHPYWKHSNGQYTCCVTGSTGADLTFDFSDGVYLRGDICSYSIQEDGTINYGYKKGWAVEYDPENGTLLSSGGNGYGNSQNGGYYYPISEEEYYDMNARLEPTLETLRSFLGKSKDELPYETQNARMWNNDNYLVTKNDAYLFNNKGILYIEYVDDVIVDVFWSASGMVYNKEDISQDITELTGIQPGIRSVDNDEYYWDVSAESIEYYLNFHEGPTRIGVKMLQ